MKSILIVIENLNIGGVQKSFVNLLNGIDNEYEIDVIAFDYSGDYLKNIPGFVNCIKAPKHYRVFANPIHNLLKSPVLFFYKLLFFLCVKLFNKGISFRFVSPFYSVKKTYDVAISYSHSGYYKSVNGICPEFVLYKTSANKKLCFIHCDYEHSGLKCKYNDRLYNRFNEIVCCSESVKKVLLHSVPELKDKLFTVRNFYDCNISKINIKSINVECNTINVFIVARISKEKGVLRAVKALNVSKRNDIVFYIIGDGPQLLDVKQAIINYRLEKQVHLLGAISSPYSILLNADYLLVPSYNEAAPIVFDEAKLLGIPVISTETLSSREMLDVDDIICENSDSGISNVLTELKKPNKKYQYDCDNSIQNMQFKEAIYF